jgi:hypothetical protein
MSGGIGIAIWERNKVASTATATGGRFADITGPGSEAWGLVSIHCACVIHLRSEKWCRLKGGGGEVIAV